MEEKAFVWKDDNTKRMFQMRFDNDWIFKSRKQPWGEFYKLLLENGFPKEMTIDHVRKKWSYSWDMYKAAKKSKYKTWKYYKMFEKHFGKTQELDKYESWSNEWRLKLITCVTEGKRHNLDDITMWKAVERAMRCQDLPEDCCIQDMRGLWHHIKMTFIRKHRLKLKKGAELTDWPLYDPLLEFYSTYEPDLLASMDGDSFVVFPRIKARAAKNSKPVEDENAEQDEFYWTKDITESFIQVRLQNDWLFCQRPQAWKDFLRILKEEHGFPDTLTRRDASKKWAATYREYQKALATDNKSWVYYNLFELYLGEGSMSINPLIDWQEEWALQLIHARTRLEDFFMENTKLDPSKSWREVEKRLRSAAIPLDHSLLDLPKIWSHMLRTFRWKQKFAMKGVLKEHWPYYDAVVQYYEVREKSRIKKHKPQKQEAIDYDDVTDYEDDMKLFDLKQRLEEVDLKPKREVVANQCRACANEDAAIDIFEHNNGDGDLVSKLKLVGGVEVNKSDNLPTQICYNCLQELENAYKFRRKCQSVDKQLRASTRNIKVEIVDRDDVTNNDMTHNDVADDDMDRSEDVGIHFDTLQDQTKTNSKTRKVPIKRKLKRRHLRKERYEYWKVCEVCGKHTKNLRGHMDMHNNDRPYSCEVCDKTFKFKAGLVIHRSIHDPTPKKTCEVCGKAFHILAQYRRHYVYHANERKYACDTCGKRFNTMDILRVHSRMHTDERPFSCSDCGKTFRTAGCVGRHKRIVHGNKKKVQ